MQGFPVLLLVLNVFGVFADPAILNLKEYTNGTIYMVNNVEEGGNLYVASNDGPASLNNIQLQTGGKTYFLSDLAAVNPDGTPHKIAISGGLTITTTNPNTVTYALTGYLYVTTAQQAQDPTFGVYVITGTHQIQLSGSPATTVILNTQLKAQSGDADQPQKSTYVSNLALNNMGLVAGEVVKKPSEDAMPNNSVSFRSGVPSGNWTQSTDQQFFMNPFSVDGNDSNGNVITTMWYFDNVEPLQIGLDYWYIVSWGDVSMDMKNTYVANHNYTATAVRTTGLLVNTNVFFESHTVNFLPDPTHSRTIGSLISAYASSTATLSFVFNSSNGNSSVQTYDRKNNATQNVQTSQLSAQTFTVSSTDIIAGVFYCQYFIFSSDSVATTVPVVTSTAAPPATSSTGGVQPSSTPRPTGNTGSVTSTAAPPVTSSTGNHVSTSPQPTVTTATPGTATTSAATVATTTSSAASISILSSVLVSIFFIAF